tara:strand:- start:24 stop:1601 length:1578 start_codon:yes stop_codon:yes gene_type:complete
MPFGDDMTLDSAEALVKGGIKSESDWAAVVGTTIAHAKRSQQQVDALLKTAAERQREIDRSAADLKAANKAIADLRASQSARAALSGSDAELRCYQGAAGSLRLSGFVAGSTAEDADLEWVPGLLDDPQPKTDWQRRLQRACEDHIIGTVILNKGRAYDETPRGKHCRTTLARVQRVIREAPAWVRKSFDSASGTGGEFIPTPLMPTLMREIEIAAGPVWDLFEEIPVSSSSNTIPTMTTWPRVFKQSAWTGNDPTAFRKSSLGTSSQTASPVTLACMVLIEDEAAEDSIFAAIPLVREAIAQAHGYAVVDAVINGDTATPHQDSIASWQGAGDMWVSEDAGTADHRTAWMGLRARAVDRNAADSGAAVDRSTFTAATFATDLTKLALPRGRGSGDLVCICSESTALGQIGALSGVLDASQYGQATSALNGEVARYRGARIVVSEIFPEDLNASGVYDGVTETKTGYCLLNRRMFKRYRRTSMQMELQRDATIGGNYLVAKHRTLWRAVRGTGVTDVVYAYNMTS